MSDRPKRKRGQATRKNRASNAHYVGYVEDEESVDAIMKKFEELERIQNEFSSLKVDTPSAGESSGSNDISKRNTRSIASEKEDTTMLEAPLDNSTESSGLTQEQLEEVFKRTSAFTVQSATIDTSQIENMDALEVWQVEFKENNTDEFFEEDEYQYVDEFFWEDEFKEAAKRIKPAKGPRQPGSRRVINRENIIAKYKVMQIQMQDRSGRMFTVKRRINNIDPSLPTYVRIPYRPISLSWAHNIKPLESVPLPTAPLGSNYHEVSRVLSTDLTQYGTDFSAVYMDPPLLLPGESPCPGKISIEEFATLDVKNIVKAGFLFIWLEKEWLQKLVCITKRWGFKYVENFCWIKKNLNNRIHKTGFTYFNKSKLSLLIFRKEGDIDLRHQRNPDCVFDFIKPKLPDEISEQKPLFMYKVIETLLPTAVYSENNPNGDKLIELWARKDSRRQGWTSVVEK